MPILSHKNHLTGTHNASYQVVGAINPTLELLGLSILQRNSINQEVSKAVRKELRDNWFPDYFFYQTNEKLAAAYKEIKELKKKLENSAANWQI